MQLRFLLLSIFALAAACAGAFDQMPIQWTQSLEISNQDWLVTETDHQDNVYLASPTNSQLDVIRITSTGSLAWRRSYDFPQPSASYQPTDISIDAQGNVLIIGKFIKYPEDWDNIFLWKLSPTGAILWQKTMRFNTHPWAVFEYPQWVDTDASGNVFFGAKSSSDQDSHNVVGKFSSTGVARWLAHLPSAGWYAGHRLYSDGTVMMADSGSVLKVLPTGVVAWAKPVSLWINGFAAGDDGAAYVVTHAKAEIQTESTHWLRKIQNNAEEWAIQLDVAHHEWWLDQSTRGSIAVNSGGEVSLAFWPWPEYDSSPFYARALSNGFFLGKVATSATRNLPLGTQFTPGGIALYTRGDQSASFFEPGEWMQQLISAPLLQQMTFAHLGSDLDLIAIGKSVSSNTLLVSRYTAFGRASSDHYSIFEGTTLFVDGPGVLANDTMVIADRASLRRDVAHGNLQLFPGGRTVYTPSQGFSGTDSFRYALATENDRGHETEVTIQVKPVGPAKLTFNPASVYGGARVSARIDLNSPAPTGGAVVSLSSNALEAQVPASIIVPAGALNASFFIDTTAVVADKNLTITASRFGVTKTGTITIKKNVLTNLTVTPNEVVSGGNTVGRVFLGFYSSGTSTVALSSGSSVIVVPPSVEVPNTRNSAPFTIKTMPVTTTVVRSLSASLGGVTKSAAITLLPAPTVSALSFNPSTLVGGQPTTGTVTLNKPAPDGGVVVTLTPNSSVLKPPPTVTVPAGQASVSFTVNTVAVGATYTRYITASYNGSSKTAAITVTKQ